ncbi:MAG: hypothetical protein KC425_15215, partial [Anaerolineales bacterium]|nr:hypothetical protein [Anaerolineales bacterium]
RIELNHVYSNTASGGSGGGIAVQFGAAATLEANTLHHNQAGSGGGFSTLGPATLYSNLFYLNSASTGGGATLSANVTLWNNTFADNAAATNGAAIYAFSGNITIRNTIIAFNAGGTNDGIGTFGGFSGSITGAYNNVHDDTLAAAVSFSNPIGGDPAFANRPAANYHLDVASPNVDAGDPATPAAVDVDIDGRFRPVNTTIDVGADEYEPALIDFTLSPPLLTTPVDRGTSVPYSHVLANIGNVDDSYTFTCSNDQGWAVTCPPPANVPAGQNASVNTTLQVPAGATALTIAQTVITATSTADPAEFRRAVVQSIVNPLPGVAFAPDNSDTVLPGDTITYTHFLTNTGDAPDTFIVRLLPGSSWAELLPSNQFQIAIPAGQSRVVEVRVTVPPFAPAGLADTAQVEAVSQFDPTVSALVADTVVARPTVGTRYVAVNGNDANNNCTQSSTPCQSIARGVNQASFNDEVYIASGSYAESAIPLNDTIHLSGGWTSGYRVQEGPEKTLIDAAGSALIFDVAPGAAIRPSISNLTLQNGASGGPGGAILVGSGAQPRLDTV